MCMVIVGGLMLADTDRLESAFERWHQLDDADKRAGQDEFRCCGTRRHPCECWEARAGV